MQEDPGRTVPETLQFQERVGVIHAADRLSLPAANSLLKITEEMPSTGTLMLLMEDNAIIPTLRSRLRVFHFRVFDREHIPEKAPAGVVDFINWAGKTRKNDPRDLISDLENWVSSFISGNDLARASNLDLVCVLAERGKLTTPMIQDLAMASLEGEVQLEELLVIFVNPDTSVSFPMPGMILQRGPRSFFLPQGERR